MNDIKTNAAKPRAERPLTDIEFRHLGEGHVGYMRKVTGADLKGRFPGLPPIDDAARLWGLFSAGGAPLVLSDEPANLIEAAENQELVTVSVH